MRAGAVVLACLLLNSCQQPVEETVLADTSPVPEETVHADSSGATRIDPEDTSRSRTIRLSGTLEAARSTRVVAPYLAGPSIRMTLTYIIPNGTRVAAGDVVARFSPVDQLDQARQAQANYEDLGYQVRQKEAENRANVERRRSELEQAQAELEKALLEVSKAEILSEIDAAQNEIRAEKARAKVESLMRTQPDQARADEAALRVLELKRDRQEAEWERAEDNLEKLQVKAPIGGMVAHATRYSGGSLVQPQEGDQMTRNNPLMSIFDPSEMLVRTSVAEPDGAALHPELRASLHVDAYPDLEFPVRFVSASPVAAISITSRIKTFTALFRLEESDPRLMPDLSAAVVFEADESPVDEP